MEVVRMSSRHDLLDEISEKLHLNLLTGVSQILELEEN